MAIVVKLKEYKADEERPDPISLVRVLAGSGLGLILVGVVYLFLVRDYAQGAHAFGARGPASSSHGAQGAVEFVRTNWGSLPPGEKVPRRELQDTDLDCPDWDGREELKGLKAMAVYEVKSPDKGPEEAQRLAEEIFGVKG